jgi:hypothetical protein
LRLSDRSFEICWLSEPPLFSKENPFAPENTLDRLAGGSITKLQEARLAASCMEPHEKYITRAGKEEAARGPLTLNPSCQTADDMSHQQQNTEVDEKEVPQQLEYKRDGGNVKMAAPVDQAERRLVRKVSVEVNASLS